MISICSLIYKSKAYADSVWKSAHAFTPELNDGRARFFFVANDATDEVIEHLTEKYYPHVIQENRKLSDAELFILGFDPPEYMRRVYQGWNRAVKESEETFVLVNSDMMFSPNWLKNLVRWNDGKSIVCSQLVERKHPKYGKFQSAIEGDFGDHPSRFDDKGFLELAANHEHPGIYYGGAYMPCLMQKPVPYYPEGNPHGHFGDQYLFDHMKANGYRHITAKDSIVYHFKEGEQSE